ncbi:MAG TPA: hypothetical protein VII68_00375 [Casimicrobiaceae bacterium]
MRDQGYILVLSHMRGHTTVFAHLLASHPEIDGHVEQHWRYETRADLVAMRARIERHLGAPARGAWLLDKLLHDRLLGSPALLDRPDVRTVVLLRHPGATIASQVRRSRTHAHVARYAEPRAAADYYIRRVGTIRSLVSRPGLRAHFVAAESFVRDPATVLEPLAAWLGLSTPIPTTFRLFGNSGTQGWGDSSRYILSGRVLRDDERPAIDTGPIDIPLDRLAAAVGAWQDLTEALTGARPSADPP